MLFAPRLFLRHPAVVVFALYAMSRLWSTAILSGLLELGRHIGRFPSRPWNDAPGLLAFLNSWDSAHYLAIAERGYPGTLPLDDAGSVAANDWAFLPLFPALLRLLAEATGFPLPVAAVVLATAAGGAAAWALFLAVRDRLGDRVAHWVVALFAFGPFGFLLQCGYAESLFVFLLFASLVALQRRRYLSMLPFGMALAFTRPGALALALVLGLHVVVRLVGARRHPRRELDAGRWLFRALSVGVVLCLTGLAWPVVAGIATGLPDAYVQTEMAWWRPWIGDAPVAPLTPWFRLAVPRWGLAGAAGVLLVAAALAGFLLLRGTRRLGSDLVGFGASYSLYLFALFLPHWSMARILLLPLAPLAGSSAVVGTAWKRGTALTSCLCLQPVVAWVLWFGVNP